MQTQTYMLNMGPQHPSTHGVLRVILELDGEVVVKATPDLGYLHRGIEKLAEARTYAQFTPYTDRLDYLSAMNNNLGYCMAVEKLAGIEVPERAQYLRVIMAELNRIASHQVFLGSIAVDLGGTTGLLYAFRDREYILDLFNIACGARMTFNYIRIGGVMADVGQDFIAAAGKFLDDFPKMLDEYHGLITGNEIFYHRLKGCAVISGQKALELGLTDRVCGRPASTSICAKRSRTAFTTGSILMFPSARTGTTGTATSCVCGRWRKAPKSFARPCAICRTARLWEMSPKC
jgi:NADH-quinone oxidoreductase subunit D